jgi:uncharacterized protein (TIGR03086 family)
MSFPGRRQDVPGHHSATGVSEMTGVIQDHREACDGFTNVARQAEGRWTSPSPCTEWDARGVLEHVIGFHDVLLLRPLDAKPERPKDDPVERWTLTVDALFGALTRPEVQDQHGSLIGVLTTDVVVHTWDLAKAVGVPVSLDPRLCRIGLERALAHSEQFVDSEMFGPPFSVPHDAGVQDRLLGFFGRDPGWTPPS